jgi:predicted transcriptional regulator
MTMRRVADAMHEPPVVVEPSTTVQEASAGMLDAGLHAAIVVKAGAVYGLLSAEQVSDALAQGYDASATPVDAIAEQNPMTVGPEDALADAHLLMRSAGRPLAAVVGAKYQPLGVLVDPETGPAPPARTSGDRRLRTDRERKGQS